jgi:ribosomal protein S18 acetylase RimI-like enzyme
MHLRPATISDFDHLIDLDGTIESTQYLHVEKSGEGPAISWRLEPRPLREKLIDSNAINDDHRFEIKQVITGVEDGIAIAGEHDGQLMALGVAVADPAFNLLRIIDIRVDYDQRRQAIGSALLYQIISHARERELRAVSAVTLTNNLPAAAFLQKAAFDMTGLDTHRMSNHDLVKESVSLFWYVALD